MYINTLDKAAFSFFMAVPILELLVTLTPSNMTQSIILKFISSQSFTSSTVLPILEIFVILILFKHD